MRVSLMDGRRAYLCPAHEAQRSEMVICIYDGDHRFVGVLYFASTPEPGQTFEMQGSLWRLVQWHDTPDGCAWEARPAGPEAVH